MNSALHDSGASERSQFSDLSPEECYALLGPSGVGRLAFDTPDGPMIYPVNYLIDGKSVVFRTSPYSRLGEHPFGIVAFEVDDLDPGLRRGWSVLIRGGSAPIDDPDESAAIRASGQLVSWAAGQRNLFVRITADTISGRRVG